MGHWRSIDRLADDPIKLPRIRLTWTSPGVQRSGFHIATLVSMTGRTPSINDARCSNSVHVRYLAIDAAEERLEPLLDVFDRLVGSTTLPDSNRKSSESLAIEFYMHIFTQEIYDIFCKDEKVYVMHVRFFLILDWNARSLIVHARATTPGLSATLRSWIGFA
jgi:hypothetical protein